MTVKVHSVDNAHKVFKERYSIGHEHTYVHDLDASPMKFVPSGFYSIRRKSDNKKMFAKIQKKNDNLFDDELKVTRQIDKAYKNKTARKLISLPKYIYRSKNSQVLVFDLPSGIFDFEPFNMSTQITLMHPSAVSKFGYDLVRAVKYLHELGFSHGFIHQSNIFYDHIKYKESDDSEDDEGYSADPEDTYDNFVQQNFNIPGFFLTNFSYACGKNVCQEQYISDIKNVPDFKEYIHPALLSKKSFTLREAQLNDWFAIFKIFTGPYAEPPAIFNTFQIEGIPFLSFAKQKALELGQF